jgi:hypothetical protein
LLVAAHASGLHTLLIIRSIVDLPLIARCIRDYAPARSLLLGSPNLSLQLPIEAFERVVLGIVMTGFFDDSGGTVLVVANYGSGPEGPV